MPHTFFEDFVRITRAFVLRRAFRIVLPDTSWAWDPSDPPRLQDWLEGFPYFVGFRSCLLAVVDNLFGLLVGGAELLQGWPFCVSARFLCFPFLVYLFVLAGFVQLGLQFRIHLIWPWLLLVLRSLVSD